MRRRKQQQSNQEYVCVCMCCGAQELHTNCVPFLILYFVVVVIVVAVVAVILRFHMNMIYNDDKEQRFKIRFMQIRGKNKIVTNMKFRMRHARAES